MAILTSFIMLGIVAIGFLKFGGADAVSSTLQNINGKEIDSTPTPNNQVNELPTTIDKIPETAPIDNNGFIYIQRRETIPKIFEDNFRYEAIPETRNEIISIPTATKPIQNTTRSPYRRTRKRRSRNVQTRIKNKTFRGGGPSFVGGQVRETPITKNSTLSFIISKLGVSASKAASIRTNLRGGLKDFDLGTNTGSGLRVVLQLQ